mmetsp:Transcript_29727/g.78404  ORF Transcript_29727/g.78404 Transcript_29727/m.78404 type:complete len:119 (-) Transcript_29727:60-416(-)
MRRSVVVKAIGAITLLTCLAFVGFVAEVLTNDDETALYQGPAQFQQLPEYIVNGAVAAPTASTAPPQGVVMQFPGSQSESEDPEAEEAQCSPNETISRRQGHRSYNSSNMPCIRGVCC